jgi:4-hydroxy-4-methyl-2-oxoglutarate aldolase
MGRTIQPELLETLRQIDTPTLANAIEAFKVRDRTEGYLGSDIRSLFPKMGTMIGYALTIEADSTTPGPVPSRDAFFAVWEALEKAPKPAVLVLKDVSPEPLRGCHFGEVMATTALRMGAVGLVTDAAVRDLLEAEGLGFQYFAAGAVCSHGNATFRRVGVPVEISGTTIRPGDLIHADVNGVLVIPTEIADKLPEAVEQVRVREKRIMDYVKSAAFTVEGMRDIFAH